MLFFFLLSTPTFIVEPFFLWIVVLLMMFPVGVYAAVDHSSHDMGFEAVLPENQSEDKTVESPAANTGRDDLQSQSPNENNPFLDDHSGHDMGFETSSPENQSSTPVEEPTGNAVEEQNVQNNSTNDAHGQHDAETGSSSSPDQGHDSSGHGEEEAKKNVLEPVKSQIVAGLLGFNIVIVAIALAMKKKKPRGGVSSV